MANSLTAAWASSAPKAFYDILMLEGGQGKLPASVPLTVGSLAAFTVAQATLHLLDHGLASAALFGVSCTVLLCALTAGVLVLYKRRDKILQSLSALAVIGALLALMSIVLHFVFAIALPPPLPTHKLLTFLLFPFVIWNVFAFAFIYRHAGLRTVPAFALSSSYVIIADYIFGTLMH